MMEIAGEENNGYVVVKYVITWITKAYLLRISKLTFHEAGVDNFSAVKKVTKKVFPKNAKRRKG